MSSRESVDPRIERTKDLLWNALVECTGRTGYAAVTVSDIARCAGVNRATLYRHFEDKEDLFRRGTARFIAALMDDIGTTLGDVSIHEPQALATNIKRLLDLMDADRRTYQIMLGPRGSPNFAVIAKEMLFEFLMGRLSSFSRQEGRDPLTQEMTALMITSSLIELAEWWIAEDRGCPAETIATTYAEFVLGGVHFQGEENR